MDGDDILGRFMLVVGIAVIFHFQKDDENHINKHGATGTPQRSDIWVIQLTTDNLGLTGFPKTSKTTYK